MSFPVVAQANMKITGCYQRLHIAILKTFPASAIKRWWYAKEKQSEATEHVLNPVSVFPRLGQ